MFLLYSNCTGDSEHWVCTAVYNKQGKDTVVEVLLLDSLWGEGLMRTIELQISQLYGQINAAESINIRKMAVQQQLPGTADCGLFAVAYATEVCFGGGPK